LAFDRIVQQAVYREEDQVAVIAVDCGGTNLKFARFESPGDPAISAGSVPTPRQAAGIPEAILDAVAPMMDGGITGIGIGVAGLVDHMTGTLDWMPHAAGSRVPISELIGDATGLHVRLDNDANLACLAEARLGMGVGHRTVLTITLGTGIGAGLVIEGSIEHGAGYLGEVGHLLIDPGGARCPCGSRGCWETTVSGRVLDAAAKRLAGARPGGVWGAIDGDPGGADLARAAGAGDENAIEVIAEAGRWLGLGMAGLVLVLDPDVIVVGGAAAGPGDLLLESARKEMATRIPGVPVRIPPPIVAGRFGRDADLVGAAMMAVEVV
jgi:glucokinase